MNEAADYRTRARVLAIDDEPVNLRLIAALLGRAGYQHVCTQSSARDMHSLLDHHEPDIILLDLNMPDCDGLDALEQVQRLRAPAPPVIVVTAQTDIDTRLRALDGGASDFVTKPFQQSELLLRLRNSLHNWFLRRELQAEHQSLECKVLERTRELEVAQREIVYRLGVAAEYRDNETGQHVIRIGEMANMIADALNLDADFARMIRHAAPMHDVGKIGIPDAILLKPGRLSAAEWDIMRQHAEIGYRMLDGSSVPVMQMAARIALAHHERWDANGYPARLSGEQIPLEARIVSICDVYDALRSRRPYKDPWSVDQTLQWVLQQSGAAFDPAVVRAFEQIQPHVESLRQRLPDHAGPTGPCCPYISQEDLGRS